MRRFAKVIAWAMFIGRCIMTLALVVLASASVVAFAFALLWLGRLITG